MLPSDIASLHDLTNVLSNDTIGATVIYREKDVTYDAGVWLKGSERGRGQDIRVGFNLRFPADQPFLGAHQRIAIDRSGAGDEFGQKEILVNHGVGHSGNIPGSYADLIRVIAPRSQNTSPAMLFKARFSDEFLDNQYANGSDGTLFEYELIYVPLTTNIPASAGPHWVEGYKVPYPAPDEIRNEAVINLGANPELYRWHYLIKNNRQRDDYSQLISAVSSVGLPSGAQFLAETRAKLDVDEWLRTFAVEMLFGINDTYVTGGLGHNALFYIRPSDGKMLLFPWDMDVAFSLATNSTIAPAPDLQKLIVDPANKRAYYGHLLDIMNTSFNTGYMTPWAQHYQTFLPGQNLTQFMSYISARESSARSQINSDVPPVNFEITTNGGQPFSASGPTTTLAGTGWVDVREIRLAGSAQPLTVTWVTTTSWQTAVTIAPGTNTTTLIAFNAQGTQLGTDTITITGTGNVFPADATNLVISEIMYHPGAPTAAEQAAGFSDAEQFEYLELQNIGPDPVTLANCSFTAGATLGLPNTTLPPGGRALVVGNQAAFAQRYGSGPTILGQYQPGSFLANSGDHLRLLDSRGQVIRDFSYSDSPPWPSSPDGSGYSLVLINPTSNPDHATPANWRASVSAGGNPGGGDATAFTGNALADDNGDGVVNLLQYAIAGGTRYLPPVSFPDDGYVAFQHRRNLAADDVIYSIQRSTDLSTWSAAPADSELIGEENHGDGTATYTWRSTHPVGEGAREFLRLQVTKR